MKSIAIILGDNDFGRTMRPLLSNIAAAIAYYTEDHNSGAWHVLLADGTVNSF